MQSSTIPLVFVLVSVACAFSPGSNGAAFSLSSYQKARAEETSKSLDASRFHFQILFVDNDNFHGRIAEGMLEQIAEYNDALFTLFPFSATIESSRKAPTESDAPVEALAVCEILGLCSTKCSAVGTAFHLSYFDEYDLIIALDDEIHAQILRSLPAESGYEQKCRRLSEFLSIDFCGIHSQTKMTDASLQNMMEPESWERAQPFYDIIMKDSSCLSSGSATNWNDYVSTNWSDYVSQPRIMLSKNGAAVPNTNGWPMVESAMLVACAGITRFCLDTMNAKFDTFFQSLLDQHFCRPEHLEYSVERADDQLRKGSCSITGYFSPEQRHARIEQHLEDLRRKFL
mmetsp:Transcript_10826/g.16363  ORF Transcript_10826/g.16363 Transcript_10826/m.16363 type:complete len:343 (+) Transcript_10826:134-1162(+)|eukprot:CAMPEP_0194286510 /NCGR_PEP_ID=MMETSP0169-20130528/32703_1 /TAXON_ID=218684 /ORGANISM="Corethron pennatum, Strain L29A3" /LENGTH=342 /DNA_ID=CAMNT_0039032979 /DNA_START=70 /DNA_END=1098 /DNA_ORIENTATION=+